MATPPHDRNPLVPAQQPPVQTRPQHAAPSSVADARHVGPLTAEAAAMRPLRGPLPGAAGSQPVLLFLPATESRRITRLRRAGPRRPQTGGGACLRQAGGW